MNPYDDLFADDVASAYVLVKNALSPDRPYDITTKKTGMRLRIDDDETYEKVIAHMQKMGVEILLERPKPEVIPVSEDVLINFKYLWKGGKKGDFVLIQSMPDDYFGFVIYDKRDGTAVLFEDSDVYYSVIDHMKKAGCEIWDQSAK